MPTAKHNPLDRMFMALADASRREIVHHLAHKPHTISELAAHFDMSLAAVSKHIKVLESAQIIGRDVDGRTHIVRLKPEQLTGALDWISIYRNFWLTRLDQLGDVIHEEE